VLDRRASQKLASASIPLAVRFPDGGVQTFGSGEPVIEVEIASEKGLAAVC